MEFNNFNIPPIFFFFSFEIMKLNFERQANNRDELYKYNVASSTSHLQIYVACVLFIF
jgi:hypothetical protein